MRTILGAALFAGMLSGMAEAIKVDLVTLSSSDED